MKKDIIYIFILGLFISSCTKETNSGLQGKWKLVETFNGYVNGGNFQWNNVEIDNSHYLVFSENGEYLRLDNINGGNNLCKGVYVLKNINLLEINSNCNTLSETLEITDLNTTNLILDRTVKEGKIRYKYIASK